MLDLLNHVPTGYLIGAAVPLLLFLYAVYKFVITLRKYGPEIQKLNTTEGIGKLFALADQMKGAATEFGNAAQRYSQAEKELAEVRSSLANANSQLALALEELLQLRNADRARQAQDAAALDLAEAGAAVEIKEEQAAAQERPAQDHDRVRRLAPADQFNRIMQKWNHFTGILRQRVDDNPGVKWDGRAIGQIAYDLVDRRRRSPISEQLADKIADLHGRYRSFVLKQDTKADWLTDDLANRFAIDVDEAVKELRGR